MDVCPIFIQILVKFGVPILNLDTQIGLILLVMKLDTCVYQNMQVYLSYKIEGFSTNFEFRNWHTMRGGLMLPDSISEEKIEID